MAYSQGVWAPDWFDWRQATEGSVRAAFIVRLPFRLRVGGLHRLRVDGERTYEICLWNKVDVPKGTSTQSVIAGRSRARDWSGLWTEAMVLLERPSLPDEALAAVRSSESFDSIAPLGFDLDTFAVLAAVNQAIVGYHSGTGVAVGGCVLRPLSLSTYLDSVRWQITVLCPPDYVLSDEDVIGMFRARPARELVTTGHLTGDLDDLSPQALAQIPRAIRLQADHIFYEFALLAKAAAFDSDYRAALLMAVIALEGAHARLVREELRSHIPARKDDTRQLAERLLREQGVWTLLQLTPHLFMRPEERPPEGDLDLCVKAIEVRNAVMHALTDARGRPKARKFSNQDLSALSAAVLRVYQCFVSALEARWAEQQANDANASA